MSSFGILRSLPLDGLKVDARFLELADADEQSMRLLNSMILLGHSMGKAVAVRGVTRKAQIATLLALECDAAQDEIFGEAQSEDEILALLAADLLVGEMA